MTTPGTSSKAAGSRSAAASNQLGDRRFSFPLEHAIDRTLGMVEQLAGDERGTVAADEDEGSGQERPRGLGQVDHLGNIGQVIAGEGHDIGLPLAELSEVVGVPFDLEIDQPNLVPGPLQLRGDQLDPQRLEPQEDLRVHQRAGMNGEDFHGGMRKRSFESEEHLDKNLYQERKRLDQHSLARCSRD